MGPKPMRGRGEDDEDDAFYREETLRAIESFQKQQQRDPVLPFLQLQAKRPDIKHSYGAFIQRIRADPADGLDKLSHHLQSQAGDVHRMSLSQLDTLLDMMATLARAGSPSPRTMLPVFWAVYKHYYLQLHLHAPGEQINPIVLQMVHKDGVHFCLGLCCTALFFKVRRWRVMFQEGSAHARIKSELDSDDDVYDFEPAESRDLIWEQIAMLLHMAQIRPSPSTKVPPAPTIPRYFMSMTSDHLLTIMGHFATFPGMCPISKVPNAARCFDPYNLSDGFIVLNLLEQQLLSMATLWGVSSVLTQDQLQLELIHSCTMIWWAALQLARHTSDELSEYDYEMLPISEDFLSEGVKPVLLRNIAQSRESWIRVLDKAVWVYHVLLWRKKDEARFPKRYIFPGLKIKADDQLFLCAVTLGAPHLQALTCHTPRFDLHTSAASIAGSAAISGKREDPAGWAQHMVALNSVLCRLRILLNASMRPLKANGSGTSANGHGASAQPAAPASHADAVTAAQHFMSACSLMEALHHSPPIPQHDTSVSQPLSEALKVLKRLHFINRAMLAESMLEWLLMMDALPSVWALLPRPLALKLLRYQLQCLNQFLTPRRNYKPAPTSEPVIRSFAASTCLAVLHNPLQLAMNAVRACMSLVKDPSAMCSTQPTHPRYCCQLLSSVLDIYLKSWMDFDNDTHGATSPQAAQFAAFVTEFILNTAPASTTKLESTGEMLRERIKVQLSFRNQFRERQQEQEKQQPFGPHHHHQQQRQKCPPPRLTEFDVMSYIEVGGHAWAASAVIPTLIQASNVASLNGVQGSFDEALHRSKKMHGSVGKLLLHDRDGCMRWLQITMRQGATGPGDFNNSPVLQNMTEVCRMIVDSMLSSALNPLIVGQPTVKDLVKACRSALPSKLAGLVDEFVAEGNVQLQGSMHASPHPTPKSSLAQQQCQLVGTKQGRQAVLYEALSATLPAIGALPMVLLQDGWKDNTVSPSFCANVDCANTEFNPWANRSWLTCCQVNWCEQCMGSEARRACLQSLYVEEA